MMHLYSTPFVNGAHFCRKKYYLKCDGFSSEGLDEDLHSSAKTENQVECGFLLDVVVGQGTAILELLSGEDQSLLVWWDALLILNLGLDVLNGITWLDLWIDFILELGKLSITHKDKNPILLHN